MMSDSRVCRVDGQRQVQRIQTFEPNDQQYKILDSMLKKTKEKLRSK